MSAKVAVLDEIIASTRRRVEGLKKQNPLKGLTAGGFYSRDPHSFESFFDSDIPVLAEIKFASPSEGNFGHEREPVSIAKGYLDGGASALSILTEPEFFKGDLEYLKSVRTAFPEALLLMKDFVVDPFQFHLGRHFGADLVLLIVSVFSEEELKQMIAGAERLDLTPLVEVHDREEFEKALRAGARYIGVNNRNLKTMQISLETSRELARLKPQGIRLISESGLKDASELRALQKIGYDGFLIGTRFMKTPVPGEALAGLLGEARKL